MSTEELPPRESMEFDVVIVGAGPSGLAAAIRLKQLNADLNIVVVEKGSEVGAHILSGAVIDPVSLDKLVPDWREDADCPLKTQVKDDRFYLTTASSIFRLPNFMMPPLMNNHHCYIGSLGDVCRWLGPKAEALGVEIYPGFAAAEVLYDDSGQRDPAAEFCDAAADEQSPLLYRLARQCLPLAGAEGGGARRRNLSGLCRSRSAL